MNNEHFMQEAIEEAKKALKIDEVHFRDASFPCGINEYMQLYEKMRRNRLNLKWLCNTRVDLVNKEVLSSMKRAGCHTIFFGVESGDDRILNLQSKRITTAQIRQAFKWCRQLGVRTGAFFIFGFPQDTVESMQKTINLAKELDCYIASFNIAMPLEGTRLRQQFAQSSKTKEKTAGFDISSSEDVILNKDLHPSIIARYKKKAIREFYGRPSYLIKYALRIRSWRELRGMFLNALALLNASTRRN